MTPSPDFRRRRFAVGSLALLLMVIAQRETPLVGSFAISFGDGPAPLVDGKLAPHLAALACQLAELGHLLIR